MRPPLTGLLLAGGLAAAQGVTPASLNSRWALLRLTAGRQSQAVTGEQAPTLYIGGASASVLTGCNSSGGHLEAGAGRLKLGT